MRYLLTTGEVTDRTELYILDLFKLYLTINPGDIPNLSSMGFDSNLREVNKKELENELKKRMNNLISKFKTRFEDVTIKFEDLKLIDESTAHLTISANKETESYEIATGLY